MPGCGRLRHNLFFRHSLTWYVWKRSLIGGTRLAAYPVYFRPRYEQLQHVFECRVGLSALTRPHNRFATRLLPCRRRSKSAEKSDVQVCQVATVVMETTQLVLSQFKNFITVNGELNKVSLCQK